MSKQAGVSRETIIVIHPSSTKLRIGRSNDSEPITIPHCIARKSKNMSNILKQPMIPDNRGSTQLNTKFNNAIKLASIAIKSSSIESLQSFKEQPTINELIYMNKQTVKSDNSNTPFKPIVTRISNFTQDFYIGQDALDLPPDAPYHLHWPFWGDKISNKYSKTAAVKDLEDIWRSTIETRLKIPVKSLDNHRIILVISDLIVRSEIRWIVAMLINELRFSHIVLQQENVCVTYSTGLPTACVVNVHDTSISISCVEEGISIPEGRIKLLYGLGDVLCLFHFLLMRIGLPRSALESYSDYHGVQALHECFKRACMLVPSQDVKVSKLVLGTQPPVEMCIASEAIIAGLALFHPALLCKEAPRFQLQHNLCDESEPDDPFDDLYLSLTSRDRKKHRFDDGTTLGTAANAGEDPFDDELENNRSGVLSGVTVTGSHGINSGGPGGGLAGGPGSGVGCITGVGVSSNNLITESPGSANLSDTSKSLSLNDAVVKSINRSLNSQTVLVDNVLETSQQLCSVILAGEALEFRGSVEWLEQSLKASLAQCGEVEVIHNDFTDGVKADSAAWKGASMIALVTYCEDLWISASDWNKYGSRALREKAPFLW